MPDGLRAATGPTARIYFAPACDLIQKQKRDPRFREDDEKA